MGRKPADQNESCITRVNQKRDLLRTPPAEGRCAAMRQISQVSTSRSQRSIKIDLEYINIDMKLMNEYEINCKIGTNTRIEFELDLAQNYKNQLMGSNFIEFRYPCVIDAESHLDYEGKHPEAKTQNHLFCFGGCVLDFDGTLWIKIRGNP